MVVFIDRSLCQTRDGLVFKSTKTEEPRKVELPPSMLACLEAHRLRQNEFRRQFGPDYRSDLDLIFANPDSSTPSRVNDVPNREDYRPLQALSQSFESASIRASMAEGKACRSSMPPRLTLANSSLRDLIRSRRWAGTSFT
jgi:hypothetical protein